MKSLGSVDDGGGRAAAEGDGDSGRLAGAARAKEPLRQSAVSRAPDGGVREGGRRPWQTAAHLPWVAQQPLLVDRQAVMSNCPKFVAAGSDGIPINRDHNS